MGKKKKSNSIRTEWVAKGSPAVRRVAQGLFVNPEIIKLTGTSQVWWRQ
jgi:hypothetical protein